MASKEEGDKREALICPVCLDVFKDATILICGHTFCKACLEAYDKQHFTHDHIRCPTCREETKLGPNRVAGLAPNFSLKGLVEALNEEDTPSILKIGDLSSEFCLLHKTEYKTIFCDVCKEFICITCLIENHQGHKIKRKEESEHAESELKKKTEELFQNCKEKKIQVEHSLEIGYQFKEAMNSHFEKLDREVRDTIVKKSTILHENERILLEKMGELRKESVEQMDNWISHRTQLITSTDRVVAELTGNNSKQKDTFKSHHLKYSELNDMLKTAMDDDSASRVKGRVMSAQFRVAEEKLLDLGYLDVAPNVEGSNTPIVPMPNGVRRESEEMQQSNNVPDIPIVKHGSLKIVKKVELNYDIHGMAACSEDTVVVGYGVSRKGSDYISVSGSVRPHLKKKIGHVHSVAFLTDGSPVVSQTNEAFRVYNPQGTCHTGGQNCQPGEGFLKVCTDKHDNIYAVNSNGEIYIFRDGKLLRVVPTGKSQPSQICVTREGHAMIISTCDTYPSKVTVYDGKGKRVTFIGALHEWYKHDDGDDDCDDDDDDDDDNNDDDDDDDDDDNDDTVNDNDDDDEYDDEYDEYDEYDDDDDDDYDEIVDGDEEKEKKVLYAAVDSKDRVLLTKVSVDSDRFVLTRFNIQGMHLIKEIIFERQFLLPIAITDIECHMVSLTPNLIAFANGNVVYFMELAE